MKIKDIRICNFRSIYGEQYFDFSELKGLIKLSGIVGSGKTTLGEAILFGLYGKVKDHKNPDLASWHVKGSECSVEINLISKNKEINIKRCLAAPLEVMIDGRLLSASNKRDTQEILETEFYDVPKLAVEKMCIISFNAFKNSLAAMNPGETRQFLDDIFGFKIFTSFNDEIINERKSQIIENNQLNTIYNETQNQINHLTEKKSQQKSELKNNTNIDELRNKKENLITEGKALKQEKENTQIEFDNIIKDINKSIEECNNKMTEMSTLGKHQKEQYNTFKEGVCPTCGAKIDQSHIDEYKNKMMDYAEKYREYERKKKEFEQEKIDKKNYYNPLIEAKDNKIKELRDKVININTEIALYENNLNVINENYDALINECKDKLEELETKIKESDKDIGEWNDMNELFSKTLRYSLLDTLIPHINHSIKYYMNKLNQLYNIEYDQEFKPHIYFEGNEKEISYSDLSTGQKKTLDIGIIFGVIANVISNVDFNIFFLDELFSNMDSNSRNIMLELLQENLKDGRTIFVVNHAEMADDFFDHKIRVRLENKKIMEKKEQVLVYSSNYEKIF